MATSNDHVSQQPGVVSVDEPRAEVPASPSGRVGPELRVEEETVRVERTAGHRDRVRWGPVWAGLLVTLATFTVLELAFFALGWLRLDQAQAGTTAGWMSGLIGLLAFFLGGVTAGSMAMWRRPVDGVVHGMLVWALTTVGIIFLTLFGGGALFGAVADVFSQVAALRSPNLPPIQAPAVIDAARTAAAWALLGLGLSFAAAALGGAVAARRWPHHADAVTAAERHRKMGTRA